MNKTTRSARAGFTLIELLVAMALLVMITLAISNVFGNAIRAMRQGTAKSSNNLSVRTALNLISSEIGGAFLSTNCLFAAETDVTSQMDVVNFFSTSSLISMQGTNYHGQRSLYPVRYFVEENEDQRMQLVRQYISPVTESSGDVGSSADGIANVTSYFGRDWSSENLDNADGVYEDVVAENVTEFSIVVNGDTEFESFNPELFADISNNHDITNNVPRYVDVTIGVLSEEDAERAKYLSGDQYFEFVDKREQLLSTRVSLMGAVALKTEVEQIVEADKAATQQSTP